MRNCVDFRGGADDFERSKRRPRPSPRLLRQRRAPAVELKVGDHAPDFSPPGLRRQDLQAVRLQGQAGGRGGLVPQGVHSGCTIECKSLAENGDMIRKFNVAYFMASVDPLEDNKGFAEKEEGRLPAPERSDQGDGDGVRRAQPPRNRQPLDVLHRQGRQDSRHRHGRASRRRRPRTWPRSSASTGRAGEVAVARRPNCVRPEQGRTQVRPYVWYDLISNSFGHRLPVTNSRSPFAS